MRAVPEVSPVVQLVSNLPGIKSVFSSLSSLRPLSCESPPPLPSLLGRRATGPGCIWGVVDDGSNTVCECRMGHKQLDKGVSCGR